MTKKIFIDFITYGNMNPDYDAIPELYIMSDNSHKSNTGAVFIKAAQAVFKVGRAILFIGCKPIFKDVI